MKITAQTVCPIMQDIFNAMVSDEDIRETDQTLRAVALVSLGLAMAQEVGIDLREPSNFDAAETMAQCFTVSVERHWAKGDQ